METTLTPANIYLITTMVVGGVQLVKHAFDLDWRSFATVFVAGIVGGIAGYFLVGDLITGITMGLSGSGLVTIAKQLKPEDMY